MRFCIECGHNVLKVKTNVWTDPGDYPSGAGGYPLPPRRFVEEVEGSVLLVVDEKTKNQLVEKMFISVDELMENFGEVYDILVGFNDCLQGVKVVDWEFVPVNQGISEQCINEILAKDKKHLISYLKSIQCDIDFNDENKIKEWIRKNLYCVRCYVEDFDDDDWNDCPY